jgi:hypothetical protein
MKWTVDEADDGTNGRLDTHIYYGKNGTAVNCFRRKELHKVWAQIAAEHNRQIRLWDATESRKQLFL